MGINSRAKGQRGEREVAEMFRANGCPDARRAQQFQGVKGSADLVGTGRWAVEVKHRERHDLFDAMEQAKQSAGEGQTPVVFFRRNGSEWLVAMRAEDWFRAVGNRGSTDDRESTGVP
jgi:Holliday junction resolvase